MQSKSYICKRRVVLFVFISFRYMATDISRDYRIEFLNELGSELDVFILVDCETEVARKRILCSVIQEQNLFLQIETVVFVVEPKYIASIIFIKMKS